MTSSKGITQRRDVGRSWRPINRGFVPGCRPPYDLELDPRDSRVLYVLTPDVGLFRSADGGRGGQRAAQP